MATVMKSKSAPILIMSGDKAVQQFERYRADALKEDVEAIYQLAVCYHHGKGTEKNLDEAYYRYKKAADQGHGLAQCELAIFFEEGIGRVVKNIKMAAHYYKLAAQNKIPRGLYQWARFLREGIDETHINLKASFDCYCEAAETMSEACVEVAGFYISGEVVGKDLAEAIRWSEKARDLLLAEEKEVGDKESHDIDVKKKLDKVKASLEAIDIQIKSLRERINKEKEKFERYQKMVARGAQGLLSEQDVLEMENLEDDNNLKGSSARYRLGYCYKHGIGTQCDLKLSFENFMKCKGEPDAYYAVAESLESGLIVDQDFNSAMDYYHRAVHEIPGKMSEEALMRLADCYLEGMHVESDPKRAMKYYFWAAQYFNSDRACIMVGLFYQHKVFLPPKDEDPIVASIRWYRKVAELPELGRLVDRPNRILTLFEKGVVKQNADRVKQKQEKHELDKDLPGLR